MSSMPPMTEVAPKPPLGVVPPPAAPPTPPPPAPPPLSTLTEKASQIAGTITTQSQFEQALTSVGGASLPPQDKGQLWDTVQKTRIGQGLPPAQVGPPGAQQPLVGGQQPLPAATNAALPASVTGSPTPQTPPSQPQAGSQPVPPPPAPGLNRPDDVPKLQASPEPTAKYQAPQLETATYTAPKYEPPKKGLEYAAMALALLFPGAPIGRAAAGFAQGLNTGAQQKYTRETDAAKEKYASDKAKDATINQGRLAQAAGNLTAAQQYDKWMAQKTTVGNENADRVYAARQAERQQGRDPDTHKPFVPPVKPPDPKSGYDGLAQWHQQRALWFEQHGASGTPSSPAEQESVAAKEATTQATNAANNTRALYVAAQTAKRDIAMHNDTEAHADARQAVTESNANARHDDTVAHEDARALLTDQGRRAEYGVKASTADKSLFTTWQQYTKPQTKTVEIKDVNGNVTGIHTVPLVGDDGKTPVPPPINDSDAAPGKLGFQTRLTQIVNLVRRDKDPEGAAAFYSAHMGNDPAGLAAQEILQQAGEATVLRMQADGRLPKPRNWPEPAPPREAPVTHAAPSVAAPPTPARPADPKHPDAAGMNALAPVGHAIAGALAPHKATLGDLQTQAIAAGLTPGTPAYTNFIKSHPHAAPAPAVHADAAGHVPGQIYEDASGHRAMYNSDGSWSPQ